MRYYSFKKSGVNSTLIFTFDSTFYKSPFFNKV